MLIAIEGTDGSGKKTQTELLRQKLADAGRDVEKISFPMYDAESSMMVRAYLNGDFGSDPNTIDPHAASMFYSLDRYLSMPKWKDRALDRKKILICDRYVGSNAIHQASKVSDPFRKKDFFRWLADMEYNQLGIPRADLTIFLMTPINITSSIMKNRGPLKSGTENDIHENNAEFQRASFETGCQAANFFDWKQVVCANELGMLDPKTIADRVYQLVAMGLEL